MLAMTRYPEQFIQKKEGGKGVHQLLGPVGQRFTQCVSAPLSFQVDSGWLPVRFFLFQWETLRWEQRRQNRGHEVRALWCVCRESAAFSAEEADEG